MFEKALFAIGVMGVLLVLCDVGSDSQAQSKEVSVISANATRTEVLLGLFER